MTKAKKLLFSLCLFFLVICLSFNTFAATTGKTTLELVENTVCTINVDDLAKFEKKITKFSKEEKSATLTLSLKNTKVSESTTKPVEVFLVIENSASMRENKVGDITREQAVINSANKLVDELFEANKNYYNITKTGICFF